MSAATTTATPVSVVQRMLWVMDRFRHGSGVMNVPIIHRLRGPLDVERLDAAIRAVVQRHDALRSRIRHVGGRLVQVIEEGEPTLEEVGPVGAGDLERRLAEVVAQDLDIATAQPLAATLVRIGPEDAVLVLTVHHLVTDAWSNAVICRDLAIAYNDPTGGSEGLPPPSWQFADFLDWHRERLAGPTGDEHARYWAEQLDDAPVAHLRPPPARGRSAPPSGQIRFTVEADVLARVDATAERCRTTPFVVLMAALHLVLQRYTERSETSIGSVFANRGRPETWDMVGFLANLVLLRTTTGQDAAPEEVIRQMQRTVLGALGHQEYPYMALPADSGRSRSGGRPESVVVHMLPAGRDADFQVMPLTGLGVEPMPWPEGPGSRFDMELLVRPRHDRLEGIFQFATDQYDREWVSALCADFCRRLDHLVREA